MRLLNTQNKELNTMTPNEFEKKLKEINPNLNVIFRDNKKATAVVILDDSSGEDIIQRPVFNLEYRTWDAMASTLLTVSERSRLNALLLEAMAYIKGPDLFVAVDNGERKVSIDVVEKLFVMKKIKNTTKKLDTGFVLKGKLEDFNDPMKYSVTKNNDGSINIILKNIKFIEQ